MDPTLVILAAGLASRFGRSKQTQAVGPCDETILDYSIFDAARAGFGEVVLVVNPDLPEEHRKRMIRRWADRIRVRSVVQPSGGTTRSGITYSRRSPWGTGHALWVALKETRGRLGVVNADDFYGRESFRQLVAFLLSGEGEAEGDACMIGFRLGDTLSECGGVSRGVARYDGNRLVAVEEYKEIGLEGALLAGTRDGGERVALTGSELVSMNMWGFRAHPTAQVGALFDRFIEAHGQEESREFYLASAVNRLIADRELSVKVIPSTDRWFGLTYLEDLASVRSAIAEQVRQGSYPASLFAADVH